MLPIPPPMEVVLPGVVLGNTLLGEPYMAGQIEVAPVGFDCRPAILGAPALDTEHAIAGPGVTARAVVLDTLDVSDNHVSGMVGVTMQAAAIGVLDLAASDAVVGTPIAARAPVLAHLAISVTGTATPKDGPVLRVELPLRTLVRLGTMSDTQQIKMGQRGKILQIAAGMDLATASSITVRVRGMYDTAPRAYSAVVSPSDPKCAELTIAAGMFDTPDTVALDVLATFPGGKVIASDENITLEIIEL